MEQEREGSAEDEIDDGIEEVRRFLRLALNWGQWSTGTQSDSPSFHTGERPCSFFSVSSCLILSADTGPCVWLAASP